ncbi:MAG TPA: hypothetical protein VHO84_07800 [Syntrophorhabdaceae bacterium]|nr:hypothetical protein [Syntrophorhabdaceae bacterium]
MKIKDVPQDDGIFGKWHGVYYVTDENGEYTSSMTSGWEPTNVANETAWEYINEGLSTVLQRVKKGELSPLAYHMNKNMMDAKVLAQYMGFSRWRVKRHLSARGFEKLDDETLNRYASVLNMTVEQLKRTP